MGRHQVKGRKPTHRVGPDSVTQRLRWMFTANAYVCTACQGGGYCGGEPCLRCRTRGIVRTDTPPE